jgi:hypothetical protein
MITAAAKKLKRTAMRVMATYFVLFAGADYVAYKLHPAGISLWLLAAVPVAPILIVTVLMGRYLGEEKDDYKRDLTMRCLLWGTSGALMVNFFAGFLRIFGWKGQLFPFTEFFVFAVMMMAAKLSYRASNMGPDSE